MLGMEPGSLAEPPALAGGALCLDFANTVDDRTDAEPLDHLPSYPALLAWSVHADAISAEESRQLERLATREPAQAERVLASALTAREAIYSVLAAAATGGELQASVLAPLNRVLKRTGGVPRLATEPRGLRLQWEAGTDLNLETPARRAVRSAIELLTGPELPLVRQCAAPDCCWLFLDLTRNHSRRWCRAEGCGVRNRFRRYYARHRKEA
jgi:predicted RNA-binding Zn ribbon-like protein